jgi:phage gp36-like protein
VSEDFVRRFSLPTLKSTTKTLFRLANGQLVTYYTVCGITFEQAKHGFKRAFYLLRDLRVADMVLGLQWVNDEQVSLQCGMSVEIHTREELTAN